MKKGLTALFLSLVMTFMLCACGSPKTYVPINTNNSGFNFNEDLAWVKYTDGQDYYGCIDNNGKMLFRCPAESFSEATIFENGYSGLKNTDSNTTCTVVGKNGC